MEIILLPAKGSTHPGSAPIATVVVLFVAFGAASIGFAGYWAKRKRDQTTAAYAAIVASVAGVVPDDED